MVLQGAAKYCCSAGPEGLNLHRNPLKRPLLKKLNASMMAPGQNLKRERNGPWRNNRHIKLIWEVQKQKKLNLDWSLQTQCITANHFKCQQKDFTVLSRKVTFYCRNQNVSLANGTQDLLQHTFRIPTQVGRAGPKSDVAHNYIQ